jgi:hypothetical protein
MAFTDFTDKTILEAWGLGEITLGADCIKGDLISRDGTLADADANKPASVVALESGDSGDTINVARMAYLQKPSTVGTGGAVTAGDHSGSADDVIWLSATAGRGSATPVATIGQQVGYCTSSQRFYLNPSETYDPLIELVASNKTLDVQDVGKQMYVTADAVVITLPATATEFNFVVVNGMNDGDGLISISPNSSDLITGPDYAGTDNKDWQNTKATARCGDRIELQYRTATGYVVTKLVGTWAQES